MTHTAPIRGRQIKVDHQRRCDLCGNPRKFGYLVNEGPCRGFFCGAPHFRVAMEVKKDLEKKYNIK